MLMVMAKKAEKKQNGKVEKEGQTVAVKYVAQCNKKKWAKGI